MEEGGEGEEGKVEEEEGNGEGKERAEDDTEKGPTLGEFKIT